MSHKFDQKASAYFFLSFFFVGGGNCDSCLLCCRFEFDVELVFQQGSAVYLSNLLKMLHILKTVISYASLQAQDIILTL